jgi:hypothetical protein
VLTPSLGATIPVLKSEEPKCSTGKQTLASRQRGRFAGSSRGEIEISGKVDPEARKGLKGTGGDAGFAEATQALDKEW